MDEGKKLLRSFGYAFRGIGWAIRTQRNMRIHLVGAVYVLLFGWIMRIAPAHLCLELLYGGNFAGDGEFGAGANLRRDYQGTEAMDSRCQGCGSGRSIDLRHWLRDRSTGDLFWRRVSWPGAKDLCGMSNLVDRRNLDDSHRRNRCLSAVSKTIE